MTGIKKTGEEEMNRRTLLVVLSAVGIAAFPKAWTKPIINSVITPAHAQTSCVNISDVTVTGKWRFTDQASMSVDIEFIDDSNLEFGSGPSITYPWSRAIDGTLTLNVNPPKAPWQAAITKEESCVASEITVTSATFGGFTAPLIGIRI